jgi:hypothetical protein
MKPVFYKPLSYRISIEHFDAGQDLTGGHMELHSNVISSAFHHEDSSALLSMAQVLPSQAVEALHALATLPPPDQFALGGVTAVLAVLYILKVGLSFCSIASCIAMCGLILHCTSLNANGCDAGAGCGRSGITAVISAGKLHKDSC